MKKLSIMALTLLCATRFDIIVSIEAEQMPTTMKAGTPAKAIQEYNKQQASELATNRSGMGKVSLPLSDKEVSQKTITSLYTGKTITTNKNGFDLQTNLNDGTTIYHKTNRQGMPLESHVYNKNNQLQAVHTYSYSDTINSRGDLVTMKGKPVTSENQIVLTDGSQASPTSRLVSINTFETQNGKIRTSTKPNGLTTADALTNVTNVSHSNLFGDTSVQVIDPKNNSIKYDIPKDGNSYSSKVLTMKPEQEQVIEVAKPESVENFNRSNEEIISQPEAKVTSKEVDAIAENIADQASRVQTPDDVQNLATNVVQQLEATSPIYVDPAKEKAVIKEAAQNFTPKDTRSWITRIKEALFGKPKVMQAPSNNFAQPRTNNNIFAPAA